MSDSVCQCVTFNGTLREGVLRGSSCHTPSPSAPCSESSTVMPRLASRLTVALRLRAGGPHRPLAANFHEFIGDASIVGMGIHDPRDSGKSDGTPIPVPGQIGDGDGNGDPSRGVRAQHEGLHRPGSPGPGL